MGPASSGLLRASEVSSLSAAALEAYHKRSKKKKELMAPSLKDRHHLSLTSYDDRSPLVHCCLVCLYEKLQRIGAPRRKPSRSTGARRNEISFLEGRSRTGHGATLRAYRALLWNLPNEPIDSRRAYRLLWSVYVQFVKPLLRFQRALESIGFISEYYRTQIDLYRLRRRSTLMPKASGPKL